MKSLRAPLVLAAALAVFAAAPAVAEDALPSAREIVDRFVEVTGAKALEDQTMRKSTGTFSVPAQGLSGTLTIYQKAPNLSYTEIELTGVGKIRQGYNGEVAWSLDPFQGPQLSTDVALAQQMEQANFYGPLYRESDVQAMEVVDQREWNGEQVYAVKVTRQAGIPSIEFFSVETGLLVGAESEIHSPMGAMPVTSGASEYEEMAGVMMATKSTMSMMGMQQVLEIESVSTEPFDESVFELPAEIKALVGDGES